MELLVLRRLKKSSGHNIAFIIDQIFVKLAGNKDIHKTVHKFEFWPDGTIDFTELCLSTEHFSIDLLAENVVDKIVLSFLMGSSSNLQTIRTGIRSRMHMNSGLILLLTLALFRLEFGKKVVDFCF